MWQLWLLLTSLFVYRNDAVHVANHQYHYKVSESPYHDVNAIYLSMDIHDANHNWASYLDHTANPNHTLKSVHKHHNNDYLLIISEGPSPDTIMYWEIVSFSTSNTISYSYHFGWKDAYSHIMCNKGRRCCKITYTPIGTVNKRRAQAPTHNITQRIRNNTQTQLNVSALITMLHERDEALIGLQHTLQVILIIIGIIVLSVVVLLAMYYYCSRDATIYRVQQVHAYDNKKYAAEEGSGNAQHERVPERTEIRKEGIATVVARWEPERFNDMLVNSDGVQKAIMDDIIVGMETEEGKNSNHRKESTSYIRSN
eukprot:213484_1